MGAVPSPKKATSRWIYWAFSHLMEVMLSRKQKRLIFLTRVFINARKQQCKNVMDLLKDDALHQCVDNVKNDQAAFELPMRIYKAFWEEDKELHPETIQDEEAFQRELETIYESTPKWLIYGRRSDLATDVAKVFSQVNHCPV